MTVSSFRLPAYLFALVPFIGIAMFGLPGATSIAHASLIGDSVTCTSTFSGGFCSVRSPFIQTSPGTTTVASGAEFDASSSLTLAVDIGADYISLHDSIASTVSYTGTITISGLDWLPDPKSITGLVLFNYLDSGTASATFTSDSVTIDLVSASFYYGFVYVDIEAAQAVPEPASLGLFGLGLAGLGFARRRKTAA